MKNIFTSNRLKNLEMGINEQTRFIISTKETERGNIFHALNCYYLKGFEIKKLEEALLENDLAIWRAHKNSEIMKKAIGCCEKYIEQDFLVKESVENKPFFLTGRFDAVIKNGEKYLILDWKSKNIPKEPEKELQTAIYLSSANKFFNTKNIEIIYFSIENQKSASVAYSNLFIERIKKIVKKELIP